MKVKVSFGGRDNMAELPTGSNLACIKNNKVLAARMGWDEGGSISFIVNGVNVSDTTVLNDGDWISIQHKAHEKAA
jgi:hypothetical protein